MSNRSLEVRRDPSCDSLLMRADSGGKFGDRVGPVDFDAAVVKPPRHRLLYQFDELADVLDFPGGGARP